MIGQPRNFDGRSRMEVSPNLTGMVAVLATATVIAKEIAVG